MFSGETGGVQGEADAWARAERGAAEGGGQARRCPVSDRAYPRPF